MRTLVITAGDRSKGEYIIQKWLPSLRKRGKYLGGVLIFDFDLAPKYRDILEKESNVFIEKQEKKSDIMNSGRHKAIYNVLSGSYSTHDIILCVDGSDVIFCKPIQPLLDMATQKICYATERKSNKDWTLSAYARRSLRRNKSPYSNDVWKKLWNRGIINCGMYVGPIDLIIEVEKFILENLKYYTQDQIWLNVLVYAFGFSAKQVDRIWNWDSRNGYKKLRDGRYVDKTRQREIGILHFMGRGT